MTRPANVLERAFGTVTRVIRALARTRSLTYARLYWLARRTPRHVTGVFRFPFGDVHYVDAGTLPLMYFEIFVDRVYEIAGLTERPQIVDCGANIGLSTIWFKHRYPGAQILAFEADPVIAGVLERNVKQLGLVSVHVERAAVTGNAGSVSFRSDGAIGGRVTSGQGTRIASVRLTDCLAEPVDLLKLDIEGSEFDVIADLCASGKIRLVRNIVCEVHGRAEHAAPIGTLWQNLTQAGFRLAVRWAMSAAYPDVESPTPFPSMESGWFVLHLYAWRADTTGGTATNSIAQSDQS